MDRKTRLVSPSQASGEKQEGKGKSPYQLQMLGARDGATVLNRQPDATRDLKVNFQKKNPTRSRTKVHKQGNAIGRSVDLTKFEGYPELISELEVLFNLEGQLGDSSKGWLVAYRDIEGDLILLGDEPWQEFGSLVAKIFICKSEEVNKLPTVLNHEAGSNTDQNFNKLPTVPKHETGSNTDQNF